MRWFPLLLIFLLAYIEISLFIRVAEILGVAITLLLVVFTTCVGVSLVKNQGIRTLMQMQQKLVAGESPAAEMVKSVSLVLAGILLLIPGFFTDLLGLLLLLPLVQKLLVLKLMPNLRVYRPNTHSERHSGETFEGEFQRKAEDAHGLEQKSEPRDKSDRP
ncbi:FxsA family protein [Serratia microhaemolytica]|uniref:FxsA family protein n=1 Tax=Serratia microhaemolytica TaxID=2675110 RepID=UPI000FDCF882|nr:FxsA family protein [Serratia microhaemolytica]